VCLCKKRYGKDYSTLKARVLGTLCEAAGPDRSIGTQYGGFVGITLFGPNAINAFLLPLAIEYWTQWEEKLEFEKNPEKRLELQMCQQAVLVSSVRGLTHSRLRFDGHLTRRLLFEDGIGNVSSQR
jgi:hypothetical protein